MSSLILPTALACLTARAAEETYLYDALDRLAVVSYANGTTTYVYDTNGNLVRRHHRHLVHRPRPNLPPRVHRRPRRRHRVRPPRHLHRHRLDHLHH